MRAIFQALEIVGIIPTLPTVEGLAADPEIATGQGRVALVRAVVIKPAEPLANLLT
jgi:ABC-type antimicrobial peptide transport system ATPase subunit